MSEARQIVLDPTRLVRLLGIGVATLVVLGAGTIVLRFHFGHDTVYGLLPKFDLELELNVPTWYSSVLLLSAALLLALVAHAKHADRDRFATHWAALAVIFVLLSMDETASLHGLPGRHLRRAFDLPGFLFYAWVIPASIAVLVLALVYARFVAALPARTRRLVVAAGLLFVGSAIGGEMAQGAYMTRVGSEGDAGFATVALVEESGELAGLLLFVFALADYLARHCGEFRITFGRRAAPGPRSATARHDPHERGTRQPS